MATKSTGLDLGHLKFIVKLCVNFGVKSLKFQGLELEFGDLPQLPQKQKPVKAITDEQHKAQTKAALEEDELSLREQQILDLQLTDPSAAEEMIVNGELDDDAGDTITTE